MNIGKDTAKLIGDNAKENSIGMSVHAPYFINLANPEMEKRTNSINYIVQSLEVAKHLALRG